MKAWWKSKTLWVNVVSAAVATLMAIGNQEWIAENPQLSGLLVSGIAILNVILRYLTTEPITFREKSGAK